MANCQARPQNPKTPKPQNPIRLQMPKQLKIIEKEMKKFLATFPLIEDAVLARGAENGVDSDNAYTVNLVDEFGYTLDFHAWNEHSEEEGWQVHGEIQVKTTDSPTAVKANVCIELPN